MSKYKKVSKDEVYKAVVEMTYNTHPIYLASVPWVADKLKTSKYQVRKYVKMLVDEGLLKRSSIVPYYPEDGESLPINGFATTEKSRETEIHKKVDKENYEFYKEIAEGK